MSITVTITGRLGADPEMTYTPSGVAVAKMRVVTDRRVKNGDTWESVDTYWHNVTAFKECAEGCAEELRKGDLVVIVGTQKQRTYETREGEKRTVVEVAANHIGRDLSRPRKTATPPATSDPWANSQPDSSDIPF